MNHDLHTHLTTVSPQEYWLTTEVYTQHAARMTGEVERLLWEVEVVNPEYELRQFKDMLIHQAKTSNASKENREWDNEEN